MNNFVQLIGHLGNDPEQLNLPSGKSLVKFSLATNSFNKSAEGEQKTHWHSIVAWGNTAERMAQLLKKGSNILIQGSLDQRSWQSEDGKMNKRTEIVARQFTILNKRNAMEESI